MKVAIIGSGISGLTAAHYLKPHADITLFEKASRLGGHTATMDVSLDGRQYQIDTGFIVYNERTYPNFIRLMEELDVQTKKTDMGFSVSEQIGSGKPDGLEYSGASFSTLFAQRKNLFKPSHWRMLFDIVRFNKQSVQHINDNRIDANMTLGDYLQTFNYSEAFRDYYLVPMGAAIWSASTEVMMQFPMQFFIKFFNNHGLLQVLNRPQWYVIEGGSKQYIAPLSHSYKQDIRLNAGISHIERAGTQVIIHFEDGQQEQFDHLIMACHSDEALALHKQASALEQEILSQITYQDNEVVLHYDTTLLPRNSSTWSSWNYLLHDTTQDKPTLTYNMNILQGISSPVTFCVTLNDSQRIDKTKVIERFNYAHPVFTQQVMDCQQRWQELNDNNIWYAGAYWRNGFHEDGVFSGIRAANGILARLGKKTVEILDYSAWD
jgi:predicted NAD/FAD-binding protein